MPPIDPLQLLKALAPLLSPTGGMKSIEEVVRLSSLMKKFSRKLVSRCVYVNVLAATPTDILEAFLAEGGWETINMWLQDSKKTDNYPFILELLKLFRTLPMTVERLKENNSAKLVKSFSKSENEDVRDAAALLVNDWMKLVKGESTSAASSSADVKAMKRRKLKKEKSIDQKKENSPRENSDKKSPQKSSERKKSTESTLDEDVLEDVKLPEYLEKELNNNKKPKGDRPKTVKTYRTKFRSTGLEEITAPPKPSSKKNPSVDKSAALAAKRAVKRIGIFNKDSQPLEKRTKPSSLITPASDSGEKPGIKLIPPKPKPIHVIKESAGFMDALVGDPVTPTRKKKKSGRSPTTTAPPPVPAVTPKFQFYKDTLDTNDMKTEESEDGGTENSDEMQMSEDKSEITETSSSISSPKCDDDKDVEMETVEVKPKITKRKKKVSWAEESNLREIFYFELDETERVNVNNLKNFGDMNRMDRMKERQAIETSKRLMMGDKMEERIMWLAPILIDLPPPLVDRGSKSEQVEIQKTREQTVLQEIYFSKDSVPDTPHEPDPEKVEAKEPRIIPLVDESNPEVTDFSGTDTAQPAALPAVLSMLVTSIAPKTGPPTDEYRGSDPYYKQDGPMMQGGMMPPSGPPPFPPFNKFLGEGDGLIPPHGANDEGMEYRGYYDNMAHPPSLPGMGPPRMRMPGPMRGRGMGNRGGPPRGVHMRGRGGPPHRGRGQRTLCRHYMNGNCKYEESCMFLHPGVNGPMI